MSKKTSLLSVSGFLLLTTAILIAVISDVPTYVNIEESSLKFLTLLAVILLGLFTLKLYRKIGNMEDDVLLGRDKVPEKVSDDSDLTLDFSFEDEEELREDIFEAIVDILIYKHGYNKDDARKIVLNNRWTDDKVSIAFVNSSESYTVPERIRAWLEEEGTFDRRLERCLKSVENLKKQDSEI